MNDNQTQEKLIDYLKQLVEIESDADIARAIGLSPSSLNQRKKRGTLKQFQFKPLLDQHGHPLSILNPFFGVNDQPHQLPKANNGSSRSVPLYDISASAGDGAFINHESIKKHLQIPSEWLPENSQLGVVEVNNDSMYPTIGHGDNVVVQFKNNYNNDGLYLVRIDGSLFVKRLQKEFGKIRIISDNPSYREMTVEANDGNDFGLIGRCCLVLRKV